MISINLYHSTYEVFQPVLHLFGSASGAGAADARPMAAKTESVYVNFMLRM